ncbi:hypothetical protein [Azospirillum doebereinerae]
MMKVYNQIRSNSVSASLLANELDDIQTNDYRLVPAVVSQTPGGAQMSAVWSNTDVTYTRGSPSGNQLSVTLVDPNGWTSPLDPTVIGDGFVIYNVDNPAPGEWQVQLEFAGRGQTINCTSGAAQFRSSLRMGAALNIDIDAPTEILAGQPLPLTVQATEGGVGLTNLRAHAIITRPVISLAQALVTYADRLGSVQPRAEDIARGKPEPMARLAALRAKLLPEGDILGHVSSVVHFQGSDGNLAAALPNTTVAGPYSVQVVVTGEAPIAGPFQRTKLLSVLVYAAA